MKIERIEGSKVKLIFDVTKEEFEEALDKAFEHDKVDVEVKGFRKGKCPRSVFETKFGVEVLFETALNYVAEDKYNEVLDCKDFEVVAQPKFDVKGEIQRGEDFQVEFVVAVKPEVKLGEYKNIEVKEPKKDVTEEDITVEINKMAEKDAKVEVKKDQVIALGDTAVFDFEGFTDGKAFEGGKAENYELEIGSNQFIPGFEEQMIGLKAGEEKEINVKFPENYNEALAGKDATFKLKIHEVKEKTYPEFTDEYVKSLNKENCSNLQELKDYVKKTLTEQYKINGRNQILDDAMKVIAEKSIIDVPEEMIIQERDRRKEEMVNEAKQYKLDLKTLLSFYGMDEVQYDAQVTLQAAQYVRYNLIIEKIIETEKIVASEEEINNKIDELAKQYNVTVEQVKQFIPEDSIKFDINYVKALDLIVENVKFSK